MTGAGGNKSPKKFTPVVPPGWRVEVPSVDVLVQGLGADLLNAFCRCFVHCDRLTSLANLVALSGAKHGPLSVTYGRDFQTATWFSIGTLRELAFAIRRLRTALRKRGWHEQDMGPLQNLWEIEKWWEEYPFHREARSKAAFHVDESVVNAGLSVLAGEDQPLCIVEGDVEGRHNVALTLGGAALFLGLNGSRLELKTLIKNAVLDRTIPLILQEVFIAALRKAGITPTQKARTIKIPSPWWVSD